MPNLLDMLSRIGSALDTYTGASSVRDLIAGENPFDQFADPFNDEKRVSGRAMLEKHGIVGENMDQGWTPDFGDLVGFAAEVVLDPTNLVGGGLLKKIIGSANKAKAANKSIEAANALSKQQRAMGFMPEEIARLTRIVDETGQPKRMYHGTPYVFDKPDPGKWDENALYGPGHYTSDSVYVTGGPNGYWKKGYQDARYEMSRDDERLQSLRLRQQHLLDIARARREASNLPETSEAYRKWRRAHELIDKLGDMMEERMDLIAIEKGVAPNVKMHFIDARNPLDLDEEIPVENIGSFVNSIRKRSRDQVREQIKEVRRNRDLADFFGQADDLAIRRFLGDTNLSQDELNKIRLSRYNLAAGAEENAMALLRKLFANRNNVPTTVFGGQIYDQLGPFGVREAGFDAIRHVGGVNTGGVPHNVVIAFDPSQVYLPYIAKELQELQRVASPNSLLAVLGGYNALARQNRETN